MSTIYVWALVFYMSAYQAGGPAVIDNIATEQECRRVGELLPQRRGVTEFRCIEVRKAKP